MVKLNEYDVEILKELASHCQIPIGAKSKVSARLEINARNWAKSNVPLSPVLLFKIFAHSFCFARGAEIGHDFPF